MFATLIANEHVGAGEQLEVDTGELSGIPLGTSPHDDSAELY